jgi:hypothetical protein
MWKLCHALFNWEYYIIPYAFCNEIVRVHTAPSGVKYYKIYGSIHLLKDTDKQLT